MLAMSGHFLPHLIHVRVLLSQFFLVLDYSFKVGELIANLEKTGGKNKA